MVEVQHHEARQHGGTLQSPGVLLELALLALVGQEVGHVADGRAVGLVGVIALEVAFFKALMPLVVLVLQLGILGYCFEGFAVARAARRTKSWLIYKHWLVLMIKLAIFCP